jgi:ABC-type phosphate transport system permease subunit
MKHYLKKPIVIDMPVETEGVAKGVKEGGRLIVVKRYLKVKGKIIDSLTLGWATSLGDTAAVMLTCGALTTFPESIMDSVRLINFHIYLLAMDIPGGMPEARSLSLLLILFLLFLFITPRLAHRYLSED